MDKLRALFLERIRDADKLGVDEDVKREPRRLLGSSTTWSQIGERKLLVEDLILKKISAGKRAPGKCDELQPYVERGVLTKREKLNLHQRRDGRWRTS